MSQAILTILRANTSVTNDLANGADSIMHMMETQGADNPYITINDDGEGMGTFEDTVTLEEINVTVTIVSDYKYTNSAKVGAYNIGKNVKAALETATGLYAGEYVSKINYLDYDTTTFPHAGKDKVILEQQFQMFINS